MRRRLSYGLVGVLAASAPILFGSTPTITFPPANAASRLMDSQTFQAAATDPNGHELVYVWNIVDDPTGKAYFLADATRSLKTWQTSTGTVEVGFPWINESGATALVGTVITFGLRVRHKDPEPTEEAVSVFTCTINGVNRAPVPVISQVRDNPWGTPAERLKPGDGVLCSAERTSDPDGPFDPARLRTIWRLGPKAGAGVYATPPFLIGSEATIMSFTVPQILGGVIDQQVVLRVVNGLHDLETSITTYLGPAGVVPPVNQPPAVWAATPVNVGVNQPVAIAGEAEDPDGDELDFSWFYLEGAGSVAQAAVTVTPAPSTPPARRWVATADLGVFAAPQTRHYQLRVRERSTPDHKTGSADVTLNVAPGYYVETTSGCDRPNTPPTAVFNPDPLTTLLRYQGGQQVSIAVTGTDPSQTAVAGSVRTGVASFVWDTAQIGTPVNTTVQNNVGGDPTVSRSTIAFTAPNENKEARVSVTLLDVLGCSRTITFSITFERGAGGNAPPVARIRYRVGEGAFQDAPGVGALVGINSAAAVTISLDASTSTDDGGFANLTFAWSRLQNLTSGSGVTFAPAAQTATLNIPAGVVGTIIVTLTATDRQNVSNNASITFNVTPPANAPPTARIQYRIGDGALQDAPAAGAPVLVDSRTAAAITLDAARSTDDGGFAELVFNWSKTENMTSGGAPALTPSGRTALLSIPASAVGTVVVTLRATDRQGASNSTTITFNVSPNAPPSARIRYRIGNGLPQNAPDGGEPVPVNTTGAAAITLDAGGSTDDGGFAGLTFTWTESEVLSAGSGVVFAAAGQTLTLNIPPGVTGSITITLTATDQRASSGNASITFDVRPRVNAPPVVALKYRIGGGDWVNVPAAGGAAALDSASPVTISLDAGSTTDDEGLANVGFGWAKVEVLSTGAAPALTPAGAGATLDVRQGSRGNISVTVTATDRYGASASVTISFVVENSLLIPRISIVVRVGQTVLVAGDQVEHGATVTMDASETTRGNGAKDNLRFVWTQLDGPAVCLAGLGTPVVNFAAPFFEADGGALRFRLEVTDLSSAMSERRDVAILVALPPIFFAHLAIGPTNGSLYQTIVLLVNDTDELAQGVIVEFIAPDGSALPLLSGGSPWEGRPLDIPAHSSTRLAVTSTQLRVGWVKVTSRVRLAAVLSFQLLTANPGSLLDETSVLPSARAKRFATYFDLTQGTAVAVANPGTQPAEVLVKVLVLENGTAKEILSRNLLEAPGQTLLPGRHVARFVDEQFLGVPSAGFTQGLLVIESDQEVIATLLKTRQGYPLSTLPMADSHKPGKAN